MHWKVDILRAEISELGSALAHLRKHDLDTAAVELLLSRK